ncbi:hypothetical protein E0F15_10225 [Frankia sp. B2]|nr:hypothetical protein E0F15_10225 [Frankia sp. B2]
MPFDVLCYIKDGIKDLAKEIFKEIFAGDVAEAIFDMFLEVVADRVADAVGWMVRMSTSWWVNVPSINLKGDVATIGMIRGFLLPIVVVMLVGGLMVQGIRLALERRVNPLVRAGRGLITYAVATGVGTTLIAALVNAGDAFSTWVLNTSTDNEFAERMTKILTLTGTHGGYLVLILLGLLAFLASFIQAVLMIFRDGAIPILVAALQLAAAGKMTSVTEGWFPRVTGWAAALVFYKPTAALVYATAFTLAGHGEDARTVFTGFTMIIMAVLALPALMRLFNWTVAQAGQDGGDGQLLTSIGFALQAAAGLRGARSGAPAGGWPAPAHARYMQSLAEGEPPAGTGGGGTPSGAALTGRQPAGGPPGSPGSPGSPGTAAGPPGASAAPEAVRGAGQTAAARMTPPTGPSPIGTQGGGEGT